MLIEEKAMSQIDLPGGLTTPYAELSAQKQELLLHFYRTCWEEMTWRRNAGYRTVIFGLGYCGLLLAIVAYNQHLHSAVRICLAGVMVIASLFGSGYLASNYAKYMSAMKRMVMIEEYVGAYDGEFMGKLGALMGAERKTMPSVPLVKNVVCIWSVVAFFAGGIVTAVAILFV
jgi:hypothetical protein